jgi:hypothetical protein
MGLGPEQSLDTAVESLPQLMGVNNMRLVFSQVALDPVAQHTLPSVVLPLQPVLAGDGDVVSRLM